MPANAGKPVSGECGMEESDYLIRSPLASYRPGHLSLSAFVFFA